MEELQDGQRQRMLYADLVGHSGGVPKSRVPHKVQAMKTADKDSERNKDPMELGKGHSCYIQANKLSMPMS